MDWVNLWAMAVNEAIDSLTDVVPELRGPREVTELAGGLTNTNYKVVTGSGAFRLGAT